MLELLEEKLKQVKNENEEKEERATVADSAVSTYCISRIMTLSPYSMKIFAINLLIVYKWKMNVM